MKKTNLVDALNMIDDATIEEILEKDHLTQNKVKKDTIMKKNNILKFALVIACVVLFVVVLNNQKENKQEEIVSVVSPVVEVGSLEELEEMLGFEVPVLDKEVENYVYFNQDDENQKYGRIIYQDGSTFDIQKNIQDESYYGEIVETEQFGDITVEYSELDEYQYAFFAKDEYTYLYSIEGTMDHGEVEGLIEQIKAA